MQSNKGRDTRPELALRSAPQERLELAPVEAEAQAPEDLAGVRVVPAVLVL